MNSASAARTVHRADGPVVQSVRIGFVALRVGMMVLALAWAVSGVREVPADQQAVVLRFGRIVRVQPAGLVIALPEPIEQIVLLPSADRQLVLRLRAATRWEPALLDLEATGPSITVPATASLYLTGDGGVVLIDAALTYRIDDAAAYLVAQQHVQPALERLFRAAAIGLAAERSLDDFLVARPDGSTVHAQTNAQSRREAVGGELAREMNIRLQDLAGKGAGLGVTVSRVDATALLPPSAKRAFDAVLDAAQTAERAIAAATTDAARDAQSADQASDRILAGAHASAEERVRGAQAQVATITSMEQQMDAASRPSVLDQVYRERIGAILRAAGSVTTVDPDSGRLILPGAKP